MRAKEVRKRSTPDLREELRRLEREQFDKRFRSHAEEKPDRGFVRRTRRERARILTVLRERDSAASAAPVRATSRAQRTLSRARAARGRATAAPAKEGS
jgi:large subunit ribosomal protein L29